jgi:hypothetical protein
MLFFCCESEAQTNNADTLKRNFYYEQGLNCTQFVKQYLSFNENSITNMPYLLTGNIGYKMFGLRYGVNYQISGNDQKTSGSASSNTNPFIIVPDQINESNSTFVDARVGAYFRKYYFKRLNLNIGADYLYATEVTKTKVEESEQDGNSVTVTSTETKSTTNSNGFGVFLAVNYRVWKNISIGTESALYYITGNTTTEGSSFFPTHLLFLLVPILF